MSWWLILGLAAGAYGFKVLGLVVLGGRTLPPAGLRVVALLPAALLAALIVVQTLGLERRLVLDARTAGVAAGALAAWRGAPFWVVIVLAAAVAAGLRAVA